MGRGNESRRIGYGMLAARRDMGRFVTYLAVGLIGTAGHYLVLLALVQTVQADPVLASAAGFATGAVINYFANYHLTFRSRRRHGPAFAQFAIVALGGLAVNTVTMAVLTKALSTPYLLAQIVATGLVVCLTFIGNRVWTFREVHDEPAVRS